MTAPKPIPTPSPNIHSASSTPTNSPSLPPHTTHPENSESRDRPVVESHSHDGHPHVHNEESLKRVVNRLSRIEGHIRGIKTMVQDSRPCPDVLVQIAAVRGALDRVARLILDEHLDECVGRAAQEGNIEQELHALKSALDRFLH
ncbi:MAG: metal-sensitive transcriptional regulator [Merismopedia sp. SIO2A8]|nr:metal-sensitive transcriptional regulator [Symploca sp. SIO2B6]NET48546.1 metal-sensitive transcriptional regulator [Merismopedia sp. SIO2A8]